MKKESTYINYHMNLSDRIAIEQGLRDGKTFNRESEILPELVIKTGIGIVAGILIAVFLFR